MVIPFAKSIADLTAHLINQLGQLATNVYQASGPPGFNGPVVLAVLIFCLVACLIELVLEYFYPVRRTCLLHGTEQHNPNVLVADPHRIVLNPLPPPQANARLQQMAAWLPQRPETPSVSLPTPPSPVYLRDEESTLENTERRVSDQIAPSPQANVIEPEDEGGETSAIELEELDEKEK